LKNGSVLYTSERYQNATVFSEVTKMFLACANKGFCAISGNKYAKTCFLRLIITIWS